MILRTFWVWLREEDVPECTAGWDQDSCDLNPTGWDDAKQQIRDAYGTYIHSEREIELRVDDDAILKHWWPDPIDAEAEPAAKGSA